MQRPPLLEADGFGFSKTRFETYIKSNDIDLWQVIQNGDFYFEIEDSKTKMMKETPYELLKDDLKKQLSKNNEANMTLYNALPHKEAKVMMIEEAKDLETLPLEKLVDNLKVYEMILENDGIVSTTTTKEMVKYLTLKAKVTREQTSDDSESHWKNNRFERENRLGNGGNRFGKGQSNNFGNKGGERQNGVCYNCRVEGHFASECTKPKENKAFIGGAWRNSEDED
ncbi:zf-CCHC domain-containing protein [Tanacetum coccineum]